MTQNGTNPKSSPVPAGFRQPAEWEPQSACWLAWPTHAELWQSMLESAQGEFTRLCRAIGAATRLEILVADERARKAAQNALSGLDVRFHSIPYGDIWVRDTAPVFLTDRQGNLATLRFKFNGWGGKYVLPHDDQLALRIENAPSVSASRHFDYPRVMEGGSLEVDGLGTCLTTRQCLLNENRNPGVSRAEIEALLAESLGTSKVLWLGDGLINDHTDGHIDTLARFTAPGKVACMKAPGKSDPNYECLEKIAEDLASFTDARGKRLEVARVPSPGEVLGPDGDLMPASFLNFYIGNSTVVVPTYGTRYDTPAIQAIAALFPERNTVGSPARSILSGGGAFHCITQQQPAAGIPPGK